MPSTNKVYSWWSNGGTDGAKMCFNDAEIAGGWPYRLQLNIEAGMLRFRPDGIFFHMPWGSASGAEGDPVPFFFETDSYLAQNANSARMRHEQEFLDTVVKAVNLIAAQWQGVEPGYAASNVNLIFYLGGPDGSATLTGFWDDQEFLKWRQRVDDCIRPILKLRALLPDNDIMIGVDTAGANADLTQISTLCHYLDSLGFNVVVESRPWTVAAGWANREDWPSVTQDTYWDSEDPNFIPEEDLEGQPMIIVTEDEGTAVDYTAACVDRLAYADIIVHINGSNFADDETADSLRAAVP